MGHSSLVNISLVPSQSPSSWLSCYGRTLTLKQLDAPLHEPISPTLTTAPGAPCSYLPAKKTVWCAHSEECLDLDLLLGDRLFS